MSRDELKLMDVGKCILGVYKFCMFLQYILAKILRIIYDVNK